MSNTEGMTNAQVALLVASNSPYSSAEQLHSLASEHLSWLVAQDTAAATPPTPNCGHKSLHGYLCTEARGHAGVHRNGPDGFVWQDPVVIDKPAKLFPGDNPTERHFRPSQYARHTTCGLWYNENEHVTTLRPQDVGCPKCKEELGL